MLCKYRTAQVLMCTYITCALEKTTILLLGLIPDIFYSDFQLMDIESVIYSDNSYGFKCVLLFVAAFTDSRWPI